MDDTLIHLNWPPIARVALVWRGGPGVAVPTPSTTRFHLIFAALNALGLAVEPVLYSGEAEETARARLSSVDGVLVWVDPLSAGKDRSRLDPLLRELAARGVWVSADPDVILKMGVKEVIYRTRELGWGTDTDLYPSVEDFDERFPARLAASGPRVLKQNRGNGGQGVWKVELATDDDPSPGPSASVRILHAQRGSVPEEARFSGAGKASAVNEYDGVRMDEDGDFARRCTVPEPLLNETQSRSHLGLSLQLSNINRIEVLANVVFGISAAERHIPLRGAVRPDDDIAQPLTPTRTQPPPSSQQPMLDPDSLSHEPSLAGFPGTPRYS